jgi:glycosyl hydrolase family 43/predicted xylan-binding protein with Ca-dependent carbohydrate-binding module
VLLAVPASAQAFEAAGHGRGMKKLNDRRASGGRAVLLFGRKPVRKRLKTRALRRITVRARGWRCKGSPRLVVKVDGRHKGKRRVRSRRWRRYRVRARVRAGRHTITVGLRNPKRTRRCRRRLAIDTITLVRARPRPAVDATPPVAYQNPVFPDSFPDPMVLADNGTYYGYATGERFPMITSRDLVHWRTAGRAMATRPSWAAKTGDSHPWAPSVIRRNGQYVMFYVSLNTDLDPDANCVGVATSPSPLGPFTDRGPLNDLAGSTDQSGRVVGCGDDGGYSNIDPASFVDSNGQAYLYLSTSHACGGPVPHGICPTRPTISVVRLTSDLLHALSSRQALFAGDRAWEGTVVENPWMHRRAGTYVLFFSGGDYRARYGMGVATAGSPVGPFTKNSGNPVITDNGGVFGAGGGMPAPGPHGGDWLVYHGRVAPYPAPRTLRIDPLRWSGSTPIVIGPTTGPQYETP